MIDVQFVMKPVLYLRFKSLTRTHLTCLSNIKSVGFIFLKRGVGNNTWLDTGVEG